MEETCKFYLSSKQYSQENLMVWGSEKPADCL